LLDATVQALVDKGYTGATTQEVCRRASASRGTLLHHFPTRNAMLVAALDHVLHRVVEDFVEARRADRERAGPVTPHTLIPLMWEQWQGPALTAWLELAVAARTNPELGASMRKVMQRFDLLIAAAFEELLPTGSVPPALRAGAPFFVFAILNGLAVGQSYEEPGHSGPVLDLLTHLAAALTSGAAALDGAALDAAVPDSAVPDSAVRDDGGAP